MTVIPFPKDRIMRHRPRPETVDEIVTRWRDEDREHRASRWLADFYDAPFSTAPWFENWLAKWYSDGGK